MDYSSALPLQTHMSDMGLPASVPCIVALGKHLCHMFDMEQDSSQSRHRIHYTSYTAMDILSWHNLNGSCSLDPTPSSKWGGRMTSTSDPSSGSAEENPDKKDHVRGPHHSLQFWECVWTPRFVAMFLIEVSEFRHSLQKASVRE